MNLLYSTNLLSIHDIQNKADKNISLERHAGETALRTLINDF